MPYAALLDNLIKNSGMTAKDISQKCNELGVDVAPSYISLLRNESRNRTPSDEVSIALAKVLGQDENYLVLERYLDNAPDILKDAIYSVYLGSVKVAAGLNNEKLSDEQLNECKTKIAQLPMADVIINLGSMNYTENANIEAQQQAGANYLDGLPVEDNAMYPTIKKGDNIKILVTENIHNGDIIAYVKDEKIYCRQFQKISDDNFLLLSYNPEFPQMTYNKDQCTLLGKVHSVTTIL